MKNRKLYLKNRRVFRVSGSTSLDFLNNILTSDMFKLKPREIMPSALLTPQGRILYDLLISLEKKKNILSILIECDLSQLESVFTKINMYNLRKVLNIERTEYKVFVIEDKKDHSGSIEDKRFINLSLSRIYDESITEKDQSNYKEYLNWYDLYRYQYCVAEGPREIISGMSLPLEINLDLLGGISFEKGCFIGQEVNARVKWRGLVKKKYVPVESVEHVASIKEVDLSYEKEIYLYDDLIGQIIELKYHQETSKFYGIAHIKLSYLYEFEKNNLLLCDFKKMKIKINFSNYLLPLPKKL